MVGIRRSFGLNGQRPYNVGDRVWNTAPAGGGATYIGWVCVTAGADGSTSTWKGFGLIQA